MNRRNADRNKRKPRTCTVLLLELLEDRTLLSILDGSFQDIMLTDLRADPAFAGIDGQGVGIAVIDSGVSAQNPDIQPNFVHWFDAVTNQDFSYTDVSLDVAAAFDPVGHGTHVAGIAASSSPDIGVAPAASLIGIRAVAAPGEVVPPNTDPIALGLQWVVAHHQDFNIRVVNLSIGNGTNLNSAPPVTSGEAALIAQLQSLGVTVVAASGNNYADFLAPGQAAPAVFSTIGVADVWAANAQFAPRVSGDDTSGFLAVETESAVDRVAASSQRSSMANQLAAPGQDVYSTWNGAGGLLFNTLSGTSMSAAIVSGSVALMEQAAYSFGGRYLLPNEVLSILKQTADTVTDYDVTTNGRVPVVNGQPDLSQETPLPETGLTLSRINIYHAVEKIKQLMQATPGDPSDPGDLNGNTGDAVPLPGLDGSGSATLFGTIGSDGQNQVGDNDVDLYQLNLPSADKLDITVGSVPGGAGFDSYLRLFNSSGQEIGSNDNISPTDLFSQLITGVLQAGLYYIGVSTHGNSGYDPLTGAGAANGTAGGAYQLTISSINPDPDGTLTGAITFGGLPAAFAGNIGTDPAPPPGTGTVTVGGQDVDMYQAVAPDNGLLVIDTKTGRYGSQGANVSVRVFDSQGDEIASGGGTGAVDNHLEVSVTTGEVLYVAVSDAANTGYDPKNPYNRTAAGAGGLYDLFLDFVNGDENGTPGTATSESDNGSESDSIGTDSVPGGGTVQVGTNGSKDVDVYSFTPAQSGLLDLTVAGQGGFVPFVSLLTPGQSTAIPAGVNAQGVAEIVSYVQPGSTYYLAVTGRGNGNFLWYSAGSGSGGMTGSYTLTSSLQPFSGSLATITNGSIQGSPASITGVTLGGSVAGNVGTDGNLVVGADDVDLYQFVAGATGTIAASTNTSAEGSASTFLRVFDANGNELAFNGRAGNSSTNSVLVVSVAAGQTYYIGVNGFSANARDYNALTGASAAPGSTGNYVLTVSGPPASQVNALPAFTGADFNVSWSATPGAGGPAVATYDVYVSDNGGPFSPFVTGASQTSATFHGITGHSYSFYSVATDQFGNRQPTPAAGQATARVDTTPPGSIVTELPAFSPAAFTLRWSGSDDAGGSGVAGYDVYVSDNGAAFRPFLTGTANTSAIFQGQTGHTYAFYSVATDTLGNRQATPSVAQTSTAVDGVAPTSTVLALPEGSKPDFLVKWTGSDTGGAGIATYDVFVSDSGGPFAPFVTAIAATSATFHGEDGHTYAFYSVATDRAGNRQPTPAAAQAATSAAAGIYVTGADAGGGPDVKVFDAATGQVKFGFFAYDAHFTGGVRVAVGDVNGDGFPDVICAAGPGGGPNISVFDGRTGLPLAGPLGSFFAFDPRFTGGLYVAAGDVNGDGFADIVCGADAGGGPNVTVFSGKDGTRLLSFFPFDVHFAGGVRVAAGDVNGDGNADIIAAAGPGGGPQVRVFTGDATPLGSFFAFDPLFAGGLYVAAGDANGDGRADVVVAAGPGGGPQVNIFSGSNFSLLTSYFAYNPAFGGGVRVATVDCNDDGRVEVVTVAGPGGGPDVRTINALTLQQVDDFFAYDMRFSGGLYVAGVGN